MISLSSCFIEPAADLADDHVRTLLDFDVAAIAIAHPHDEAERDAWVRAIRGGRRRVITVAAGLLRRPQELAAGTWPSARLCATDPGERQVALADALNALEYGEQLEAQAVSLPAGAIDTAFPDAEVRQAFAEGRWRNGPRWYDDDARRRAQTLLGERISRIRRHLDSLKRSLEVILDRAGNHGLAVVLEHPVSPFDLPACAERVELQEEFRGAPLNSWLDLARADRLDRLGFEDLATVKETVRPDLAGITLSDGVGLDDGFPPGSGQIPFKQLLHGLVELEPEEPRALPLVVRTRRGTPVDAIAEGLAWVRDSGLDGPPPEEAEPFPIIGG